MEVAVVMVGLLMTVIVLVRCRRWCLCGGGVGDGVCVGVVLVVVLVLGRSR